MKSGSRSVGSLTAGAIIVGIGIILLLQELGLPSPITLYFWPSVIIALGTAQALMSDSSAKKSIGVTIVLAGFLLEVNDLHLTHINLLRLWPLLIVAVGLLLLWPSKQAGPLPYGAARFDMFFLFSGADRKISSKNFEGGRLMAVFGGYKLDFSDADIEDGCAVLNLGAVFGGGEIIGVPENWRVIVDGTLVFGAYEDRTRYVNSPDLPTRTLIIKGIFLFGGFSVRN